MYFVSQLVIKVTLFLYHLLYSETIFRLNNHHVIGLVHEFNSFHRVKDDLKNPEFVKLNKLIYDGIEMFHDINQ